MSMGPISNSYGYIFLHMHHRLLDELWLAASFSLPSPIIYVLKLFLSASGLLFWAIDTHVVYGGEA